MHRLSQDAEQGLSEHVINPIDFNEADEAFKGAKAGIAKIVGLLNSMKEFSHPGGETRVRSDINHVVDLAVTLTKNQWKYYADVNFYNKSIIDRIC